MAACLSAGMPRPRPAERPALPGQAGTGRPGGAVGLQACRLRAGLTFTANKVYVATAPQTQQLLGDLGFYVRYFSDFSLQAGLEPDCENHNSRSAPSMTGWSSLAHG